MAMAHLLGHQVVGITVSFAAIAFTMVCLRLFIRFFVIRNAGMEDICISLAMVTPESLISNELYMLTSCSCFQSP
jgi:hypothetical protein